MTVNLGAGQVTVVGQGEALDRGLLSAKIGDLGFSVEAEGQEPDLLRRNWVKLLARPKNGKRSRAAGWLVNEYDTLWAMRYVLDHVPTTGAST